MVHFCLDKYSFSADIFYSFNKVHILKKINVSFIVYSCLDKYNFNLYICQCIFVIYLYIYHYFILFLFTDIYVNIFPQVHGYLRSSLERLNASPVRRPERSCSMSTQFTMVSNKSSLPRNGHSGGTRITLNSSYPPRTGSGQNYIPLDTIQKNMDTSLLDYRGHNSVM